METFFNHDLIPKAVMLESAYTQYAKILKIPAPVLISRALETYMVKEMQQAAHFIDTEEDKDTALEVMHAIYNVEAPTLATIETTKIIKKFLKNHMFAKDYKRLKAQMHENAKIVATIVHERRQKKLEKKQTDEREKGLNKIKNTDGKL